MAAVIPESGFATFEAPMSHETFGGNVSKHAYGNVEVVDPTTDFSAEQAVEACRVLARAQWTMPFAIFELTIGTDTSSSSINFYKGQNGVGLTHAPPATWQAAGHIRVRWSSTYTDEYGIVGTTNITMATGTGCGTAFLNVVCEKIDAGAIDIYYFDAAGAAVASRTSLITVHTMGL